MRPDAAVGALASLGIPAAQIVARGLVKHAQADDLVVVHTDARGRQHRLTPATAAAWHALVEAAHADEIALEIASAFRSIERQAELIRRKLDAGMALDAILEVLAPPGYSEHHTGRAVDVATPGTRPLDPAFEHTRAFDWLARNAAAYGWSMSYPRGNTLGFVYEPWHWCYRA